MGPGAIAFVVKKQGMNISTEELQQFCLERLAKYKVPKEFYFAECLPRNAAKKLLRRKLREWVLEGGNEE